jgi:hypothetical protein
VILKPAWATEQDLVSQNKKTEKWKKRREGEGNGREKNVILTTNFLTTKLYSSKSK